MGEIFDFPAVELSRQGVAGEALQMSVPEQSQVFLNAESFAYSFIYLYIHFNRNLNIHALISCEGRLFCQQ